jgi:hypothetical protein
MFRKTKSTGDRIVIDFQKSAGSLLTTAGSTSRIREDTERSVITSLETSDQRSSRHNKAHAPKHNKSRGGDGEERRRREEEREERRRKEEARRSMEEKVARYSHLPVYNKEEEQRKAREREARLAQLFSGKKVKLFYSNSKLLGNLSALQIFGCCRRKATVLYCTVLS